MNGTRLKGALGARTDQSGAHIVDQNGIHVMNVDVRLINGRVHLSIQTANGGLVVKPQATNMILLSVETGT